MTDQPPTATMQLPSENATVLFWAQHQKQRLKQLIIEQAQSINLQISKLEQQVQSSNLKMSGLKQADKVARKKLKTLGYTELFWLPSHFCKIPYQQNGPYNATEWDGVLTCKYSGVEFLFLMEAKSTSDQRGATQHPYAR